MIELLPTAGLAPNDPRHVACNFSNCDQQATVSAKAPLPGPVAWYCPQHAIDFTFAWDLALPAGYDPLNEE